MNASVVNNPKPKEKKVKKKCNTYFMRVPKIIIIVVLLSKNIIAQKSSDKLKIGKAIFTTNCASCHSLTKRDGTVMSEPLQYIRERRGKEYVYQFVWNNMKLLASGNKTALRVYNEAKKIPMNVFPSLTKDEIDAICDYIDTFPTPKKEEKKK